MGRVGTEQKGKKQSRENSEQRLYSRNGEDKEEAEVRDRRIRKNVTR